MVRKTIKELNEEIGKQKELLRVAEKQHEEWKEMYDELEKDYKKVVDRERTLLVNLAGLNFSEKVKTTRFENGKDILFENIEFPNLDKKPSDYDNMVNYRR
jgi:rubrerythrin